MSNGHYIMDMFTAVFSVSGDVNPITETDEDGNEVIREYKSAGGKNATAASVPAYIDTSLYLEGTVEGFKIHPVTNVGTSVQIQMQAIAIASVSDNELTITVSLSASI